MPAQTSEREACPIYPECFHRENCDRSMCLLFFQPTTTYDILKDAVREWLESDALLAFGRLNYGGKGFKSTDVERFITANCSLFKTDIAYTTISKIVFNAVMEVIDE